MATPIPAIKLTYADYCKTPDDERYELLDGNLIKLPTPGTAHQRVLVKLLTLLAPLVDRAGVGELFIAPFDVVLSDSDVVEPDLLFVSSEREHIVTEENVRGAPDLVIEILSPATAERDRTFKRALYARHGVKEYWLVDTDAKTVTVLVRGAAGFAEIGVRGEGQFLESPTLAGFTITPDKIF